MEKMLAVVVDRIHKLKAFMLGMEEIRSDPGMSRIGFGLVEQISFSWGRAQIYNDAGKFRLRLSSTLKAEHFFPIPKEVIADAIAAEESTVFSALEFEPKALRFIGDNYYPPLKAILEKGDIEAAAAAARASSKPVKKPFRL